MVIFENAFLGDQGGREYGHRHRRDLPLGRVVVGSHDDDVIAGPVDKSTASVAFLITLPLPMETAHSLQVSSTRHISACRTTSDRWMLRIAQQRSVSLVIVV